MSGVEKTQGAIRKAMEIYRSQVLHERYFDVETGFFKYPHQITEKDVLSLAGIKSRSTLKASYHDSIKAELKEFVLDLKVKAGRRVSSDDEKSPEQSAPAASKKARVDQLAETIGALQYKIIALQKELEGLKKGGSSQSKIDSHPSGAKRKKGMCDGGRRSAPPGSKPRRRPPRRRGRRPASGQRRAPGRARPCS